MKYKYALMNLSICPHICLDQKIEDQFWIWNKLTKSYIINRAGSARNVYIQKKHLQ